MGIDFSYHRQRASPQAPVAERHEVPAERGHAHSRLKRTGERTMSSSQEIHAVPTALEEIRENLLIFEGAAILSINTSRRLARRSRMALQESRQLLIKLARREALSSYL
jgi:hypothetical protein